MLDLSLSGGKPLRRLLLLGAHADDIEIGCAGTVCGLLETHQDVHVDYVVCTATPARQQEARASAAELLAGAASVNLVFREFRNGFFPYVGAAVKEFFEELKSTTEPDLILTHARDDRHQDHRIVSELTWNTFRNHLVLEYEVPKYDGELAAPNVYVPLTTAIAERKLALLAGQFKSQRAKPWYDEQVFRGLLRLRGVECHADSGYAEAFTGRKLCLTGG